MPLAVSMFSKLRVAPAILFICIILHPLYAIEFDDSCKDFGNLKDVTDTLTDAVTNAIGMADNAWSKLDILVNNRNSLPKSEAQRFEALLTAFFIPPNVTPGYYNTNKVLLSKFP